MSDPPIATNAQLANALHVLGVKFIMGGQGVEETFLEEIYQSMKRGESVTIQNFGGFYVRPGHDTWVFKFNPSQKWKALFGWSSSYQGDL